METTNNNNLESFAISSNLFPCVYVGMYESLLSPTRYEEDMSNCMCDDEHPFSYTVVDNDTWRKEIVKCATNFINENVVPMMKKYGLESIDVEKIHSPQYYNFESDCLYFTVNMAANFRELMHKYLAEFRKDEKFEKYIEEHWYSHSGFCSFMPQDFDDIEEFDDEERCIGAYLTLCLLNENGIGLAEEFYEDCGEWLWENTEAAETYDMLEEQNDQLDSFDCEELVRCYRNDNKWNEIYWNLVSKFGGFPWLHESSTKCLDAKHDGCVSKYAENDGMRLLFWAAQQGHTVQDLERLAA
ncbi:MAG: hypothetical protein J5658_08970 [Prevotella sp.]|nr:hypothetical protein [Prevotella sp.]